MVPIRVERSKNVEAIHSNRAENCHKERWREFHVLFRWSGKVFIRGPEVPCGKVSLVKVRMSRGGNVALARVSTEVI